MTLSTLSVVAEAVDHHSLKVAVLGHGLQRPLRLALGGVVYERQHGALRDGPLIRQTLLYVLNVAENVRAVLRLIQ